MLKYKPCLAVIGVIGRKGLLHIKWRDKSIDSNTFLEFLKELRDKEQGHLNLLLDNASIHFTKKVTYWADDNEVNLVRN